MGLFSSTKGKKQHRFGQMKQMLQDELREEARADAAAECHAEEAQCEAEDAPAGAADATEIMSPGEVVVEGVVVEQPAEPTAGEVLGISKRMGVKYVGKEGIVGPLRSTDAVVDVFAMDRGLFDAANAAKARTHWLHGEPGNLALFDIGGSGLVELCCVPPVPFLWVLGCLFGSLFALCD